LAKELGVASKEVIAKCQAEGIELKNHMSTISVGLAESIREWFSAGDDLTSIESAPSVDLTKVTRRKKTEAKPVETPAEEQAETDLATEQAPAARGEGLKEAAAAGETGETAQSAIAVEEPPTAETPAAASPADEPEPVGESATTAEQPPAEEAPTIAAESEPEPEAPAATEGSDEEAQPPAESEEAGPAGPQLVPTPAELKGPRVVRIEAPEQVRTPRPRPPARPATPRGPALSPEEIAAREAESASARKKSKGKATDERDDSKRGKQRRAKSPDPTERLREWRDQDLIERKERLASATGQGFRSRKAAERRRQASSGGQSTAPRKGEIEIEAPITLKDYCAAIGVPFARVMRKVMEHTGKMMMINQSIDAETAEIVAMELGVTIKIAQARTEFEKLEDEYADRERTNLEARPPIVAMLGHVDHGKTSLLDRIRDTTVAAGEAGGITQHIGASRIETPDGPVTFLDTPGHQAFTNMRARGANLTDVVVLVVAADDGVMPQTAEAIAHAKAAGVQIVVALNKIDLPGVDVNRVYAQLAEHELVPSEWGGTTDVIRTSAQSGEGIEELLTHLSTLSELLELKADATVPARATVIEAEMVSGQGVVARVLVQEGILKTGMTVVCGPGYGRVRSLLDPRGKRIEAAGPGTPVTVVGLDELPDAGDRLYQVDDNKRAQLIAGEVKERRRQAALATTQKAQGLEALLASAGEADTPTLNLIIKADAQGSVETLKAQLGEFPQDKVELRILHAGVGAVTEADVALAQASAAIVIGFHVVADDHARQMAERSGVEIRTYRVIYEILEDVHKALEGLLEPDQQQEQRGVAEVRQIFNVGRLGTIAGCYVTDGIIGRNHRVRLVRDGRIVLENAGIDSLKRFKDDAKEVRAGLECGIKIEKFDDVKPGDRIEAFEIVEVSAKL
jgi:translation initiation factor IF-2